MTVAAAQLGDTLTEYVDRGFSGGLRVDGQPGGRFFFADGQLNSAAEGAVQDITSRAAENQSKPYLTEPAAGAAGRQNPNQKRNHGH